MCAVSSVGDDWTRKFQQPYWQDVVRFPTPLISVMEFEKLRKELQEMREELRAAKKQDEEEGNPDCEMEEKVALLKQIADKFGVSLEDVFGRG